MRIALVALFIGVSIVLWVADEFFTSLLRGAPGFLSIVGVAFFGNLTIFLPAPAMGVTMPFVVGIAGQEGLFLVAGLYALGSAFGETSGYLLGRSGKNSPLGNSRLHQEVEKLIRVRRTTDLGLIILSAFPVILPFDMGGMIAGSIRHPYWRFLISTFLGRWMKYIVFIWLWTRVANVASITGVVAAIIVVIILGLATWWYRRDIRRVCRNVVRNGIIVKFVWG